MTKRALLFLAPVAAVCFLAAGCGGDDKGGGGDQLSKAEFIDKADGICKEFNDKGEKIEPKDLPSDFDPTSPNATDEQLDKFGDYLDEVHDVFGDEVDELHDLDPPDELDSDWTKGLALLDETLNELDEAAEAAHDADRDKLKEKLEEGQRHGDESDALAKKIGLKVCGS